MNASGTPLSPTCRRSSTGPKSRRADQARGCQLDQLVQRGKVPKFNPPLTFATWHTIDHNNTTMFGAFRITNPLSSGLLWKVPWRLSKFQKRRHRMRLRAVDSVVATVDAALAKKGQTLEALERWKAEMPTEPEMLPRDKYTMFDRKAKRYRKGIHSTLGCAWTRRQADFCSAAQVDEGFPAHQPPRLLSWTGQKAGWELAYKCIHFGVDCWPTGSLRGFYVQYFVSTTTDCTKMSPHARCGTRPWDGGPVCGVEIDQGFCVPRRGRTMKAYKTRLDQSSGLSKKYRLFLSSWVSCAKPLPS